MTLQEYTTEELKSELKRRYDLDKVEKNKIKRCRMCKHWGEITYFGTPTNNDTIFGLRRCCTFFKTKNNSYYKTHLSSKIACEHFEEIN